MIIIIGFLMKNGRQATSSTTASDLVDSEYGEIGTTTSVRNEISYP